MRKTALLFPLAVLALASAPLAQQPGPLKAAADTLGVADIKTLRFVGAGAAYQLGQNFLPTDAWPPVPVKIYTASINFDTGSLVQEQVRDQSVPQARGGGAVFNGNEQRLNQVVSGDYAWNVPVPPPAAAGTTPAAPAPQPAPAARLERTLTLWATPQGFVKAAMANNATTKTVPGGTEVSFVVEGKYKMTGLINAKHQVVRVKTWIDHPLAGDMLVETEYGSYYDFGGVLFPMHMLQKQDGFPTLDLVIASVTPNPPVEVAVPDSVRNAPPPPAVVVASQQLADGVFYLTGGTHHSLAVEMSDYIVLVDTPNNEARAVAVIAKTKELIPNKPIRFVVTSHHHWDHLGGIRAAIDEGAVIVTSETNKALLIRLAKAPHTIVPDRLAASKKPLKIQTVGANGTLTDGTRIIELHTMTNFRHAGDMMLVYLPKEKVLAEPDAFTPPATPTTPFAPVGVPYARALWDNIQRLQLDVQTIAPFHGGRTADIAELARDAGASTTIRSN